MYAGNATITLKSLKSGDRFTYRIKKAPEDSQGSVTHFVSVLTGQDNEKDYTYLGHIYKGRNYTHGKKSTISLSALSSAAWEWFYNAVIQDGNMRTDRVEIWHEGRCGKCNRKLTVPESIEHGIGPECAKQMGYNYGQQELPLAS